VEVVFQALVKSRHVNAVAARRLTAGVLRNIVMGQPEPVRVTEQAKEIPEPMARLSLGLQTEQPLHFADIHGYHSATWLLGYLCLGPSDELPPFPL
jgi:hypothetical protein